VAGVGGPEERGGVGPQLRDAAGGRRVDDELAGEEALAVELGGGLLHGAVLELLQDLRKPSRFTDAMKSAASSFSISALASSRTSRFLLLPIILSSRVRLDCCRRNWRSWHWAMRMKLV
jgi:hypothetical protein